MGSLLLAVIYLAFISLGLPDSLLGSGWPTMQTAFQVPSSYAGYVSMVISCMTIISALMSPRLIRSVHTKWIVVVSTGLTIIGLFGFSFSKSFWMLCLWAVPYGLGAGSVDAALNNYVAVNYNAMQMSFLHCFYGIGVSLSPYLMSLALSDDMNWRGGYRTVFFIQLCIAILSIVSLPLWKKAKQRQPGKDIEMKLLSSREMLGNPRILAAFLTFVGISALESTCLIWGSTFLVDAKGMGADTAAKMITFYFVGMALGRFFSGLLSVRFNCRQLIRAGQAIILAAVLLLLLPVQGPSAILGLFLIGMGNGPLFPNMTHLTPVLFGIESSQSIISMEMAFSNASIMLTPVFFGFIAQHVGTWCFPPFLLIMFLLLVFSTWMLDRKR